VAAISINVARRDGNSDVGMITISVPALYSERLQARNGAIESKSKETDSRTHVTVADVPRHRPQSISYLVR
jgi:hypothetical protein